MDDAALFAHYERRRREHPAYQGWLWSGTIPLDEAARKGIVLRRIDRWLEAVELQHARLCSSGNRHASDLHFYVLAVDNLADAVEVIRKQYTRVPGVSRATKQSLKQFRAACPHIHTLRNLIEHFDEYDHLVGDLQQSGVLPKLRMGQVENYSLLLGDAQLSIFGKSVTVSTTTLAARQLASQALALGPLLPG